VFLQGIGGAARLWDLQVESFAAAGYTPVALDLPGYGARPPVDAMDFDMLAADVEAAVEARGLDRRCWSATRSAAWPRPSLGEIV
jgi:pimeloyl-ACP methyl ester carboxylesterase